MGKSTHLSSFNVFADGKTSTLWSIMVDEFRKIVPETWGVSAFDSGVVVRGLSNRHNPKLLDALRNCASLLITGKPTTPPRKVY